LVGGKRGTTLAHHTKPSTNLIPKVDKELDKKNMAQILGLLKKYWGALLSDRTTSVQKHPVINIILALNAFYTLGEAFDTSGEEKTMQWTANHMIRVSKVIGEGDIYGMCTDGAVKGAFQLISKGMPWVATYTCLEHGVNLMVKNVCSSNEEIRMQANKMGGYCRVELDWNEPYFKDTIEEVHTCVKAVTAYQKSLYCFHQIAEGLLKSGELQGCTEPLKFGATRYGSRVLEAERVDKMRMVYENLMLDQEFQSLVKKQLADVKAKVGEIPTPNYISIFPFYHFYFWRTRRARIRHAEDHGSIPIPLIYFVFVLLDCPAVCSCSSALYGHQFLTRFFLRRFFFPVFI
jgi:hypothetical protein